MRALNITRTNSGLDYHLTIVDENGVTTNLAYDGVGNRLSEAVTLNAATTTRLSSYDALSNRITGMTENSAALRSYTHDGGGNIVTDTRPGEVFGFSYNAGFR